MHSEGTATVAAHDVDYSRKHHKRHSRLLLHLGCVHILLTVSNVGPMPKRPQARIVTGADVEVWRDEVNQIAEQARQLEERRVKLVSRIEAALVLFDLLDDPPAVGSDANEEEPALSGAQEELVLEASGDEADADSSDESLQTFTAAVHEVVRDASEGIAPWEVKRIIGEGPLGVRLDKSDKAFYNAVSRLAGRGSIIRHNGKLFFPEKLESFLERVAAGLAFDKEAKPPTAHSPMGEAIKAIVAEQPGVKGGEIIRKLKQNPEFAAALTPHTNGAFNIIARLVSRGQISRVGRDYYPGATVEDVS